MVASFDFIDNAVEALLKYGKVDKAVIAYWTNAEREKFEPFEMAPKPDHAIPYLLFERSDPTPIANSTGTAPDKTIQYNDLILNFIVFGKNREQAIAVKNAVIAAFEAAKLDVTQGCAIGTIQRNGDTLRPFGDDEWRASVSYTVEAELTLDNDNWTKKRSEQ